MSKDLRPTEDLKSKKSKNQHLRSKINQQINSDFDGLYLMIIWNKNYAVETDNV